MANKTSREIFELVQEHLKPVINLLEEEGLVMVAMVKNDDDSDNQCGVTATGGMSPLEAADLLERGAITFRRQHMRH